MSWFRRFVNLIRSDRLSRDIEREIDFHVAERVDDLVAGGMREAEARRAARRMFGHRGVLRQRVREVDMLTWLEAVVADVRYAGRALRSNPGFTLVAVLSLGLGIGANTAIFSLIDAVMFRSLPVRHPEELVQINMGELGGTFTNPQWEAIRDQQDVLDGALAFADTRFNLSSGGIVRRAAGAWVSGGYFQVLGVPARIGRVFQVTDDLRGCGGAAVLSHDFWQREYGGAPDIVGRTISLDGYPFDIIGVSASGFSGVHVGVATDVFVPLCAMSTLREQDYLDARSTWFLSVFGRLRAEGSLAVAQAGLASLAPAVFEATIPMHWNTSEQRDYTSRTLSAVTGMNGMSIVRRQYQQALLTLLVVVGIVLMIACANVAQLLLARATAREPEIAVRLALGSSRARLVRQLLTESVVLALLGAAVGTLFARWSSGLVVGFLSTNGRTTISLDLTLDVRVLCFTIAVATLTGMFFGLAPAWRAARVDPQMALRGARGVVGDLRHRFAKGIVIGQVSLSLVLVTGAGLLVGSFRRLSTLDLGFKTEGVLVVHTDWSSLHLDESRQRDFYRALLERIRGVAGVRQAAASVITPISGSTWNDEVAVEGHTPAEFRDALVWFNAVTDGYLGTLGTRLLAGRDFTPRDRAQTAPVVIVNQTLARRFFQEATPLSEHLRTVVHDSLGPQMEIVGIVKDAKYASIDEEIRPTAFVPLDQRNMEESAIELVLRTDGPPSTAIPEVTRAIREMHPAIALEFTTLHDQVTGSLARQRLLAVLSGFFGVLALLLAVIGLYGTMSYSVARRRNEIGIRIALGAARSGMVRMIAGEAGAVIAIGVIAGSMLALAATRLVAAFLYGVTPSDPLTLAFSALLLAAVAMVAGLVPAWRAAGVDPMVALREE